MKMGADVTLFNFDGAYRRQSFYLNKIYNWIDFESIPNISRFCEKENLKYLTEKITEKERSGIYYLGSGNYHYMSYILQSPIDKPYTLVLFDHHTDTIPSPSDDLISCGSWVLESLHHLPMLKKVFIIGVSEEGIHHIPASIHDKVELYTKHSLQSNLTTITKSIIKNIPTESVYISMDKDVLDEKEAVTGWDHGTLQLKQMLMIVKAIIQSKKVISLDVCGEYPVDSTNDYLKETKEAVAKNDRANKLILETTSQWINKKRITSDLLHA
jgi:arginase family enzyme